MFNIKIIVFYLVIINNNIQELRKAIHCLLFSRVNLYKERIDGLRSIESFYVKFFISYRTKCHPPTRALEN